MFPETKVIFDWTEQFTSSSYHSQSAIFLNYTHQNIEKLPAGIATSETVTFVSNSYTGWSMEKKITKHCDIRFARGWWQCSDRLRTRYSRHFNKSCYFEYTTLFEGASQLIL